MITLSGALGLSLVLTLLFILLWSVFTLSNCISILILKTINHQIKINKKQLSLLSAIISLGILILHFLSSKILESINLSIKFQTLAAMAIYLLNMFAIFLLITAFFKLKKLSISHFNLLYLSSSIVSLVIWAILFYFFKGYIALSTPLVFIPAVIFLALHETN